MARLKVIRTFNTGIERRPDHAPGLVKVGELKGKELQDALKSAWGHVTERRKKDPPPRCIRYMPNPMDY